MKEEICGFMILAHYQVTINLQSWWSHYRLKVKNHPPIIATITSKVCNSCTLVSTGGLCDTNNEDNVLKTPFLAGTNKHIHINQEGEEGHNGEAPNLLVMVKLRCTGDLKADNITTETDGEDTYKMMLYIFGSAGCHCW
jgi:hypothetical protein